MNVISVRDVTKFRNWLSFDLSPCQIEQTEWIVRTSLRVVARN